MGSSPSDRSPENKSFPGFFAIGTAESSGGRDNDERFGVSEGITGSAGMAGGLDDRWKEAPTD